MNAPQAGCDPGWRFKNAASHGFTLIELLVSLSVVALLASLIVASIQGASRKAQSVQCLSKMRALGQGIQLYTQDSGEFPRSMHSAASAGQLPWATSIMPYLGYPESGAQNLADVFEISFRCPLDPSKGDANVYSYALNVYFELTPDGDDYEGSPATWRRPASLQRASATILLTEPKKTYFADHVMCHQWTSAKGAANAVDSKRHGRKSNFLFADGHAEALTIEETFDSKKKINLWNPSMAARR